MKKGYVSVLAICLMLSTFAVPARANGTTEGRLFSIHMQNFADTVTRGENLTGTITLAVGGNPLQRFRVRYDMFIVTPLGDAPLQSGTFRISGETKRSVDISMPVSPGATPGTYTIRLVVTVGNETLAVDHVTVVTAI